MRWNNLKQNENKRMYWLVLKTLQILLRCELYLMLIVWCKSIHLVSI